MATHSSILSKESHGQGSLVGHSPWGHKELDVTKCVHACTHTHVCVYCIIMENISYCMFQAKV